GEAPERLGDVPERLGEAPERLGEAPERLGEAPERLRGVPERLGEAPERLGEAPERLGEAPERLRDVPERLRDVPERLGDAPERLRPSASSAPWGGAVAYAAFKGARSACVNGEIPRSERAWFSYWQRDLPGSREFDTYGSSGGVEVDHHAGLHPFRPATLLVRISRKIEVGRDRSAVPKGHFKIMFSHLVHMRTQSWFSPDAPCSSTTIPRPGFSCLRDAEAWEETKHHP
ncbi:MAG TPA: hypothetical protein VNW71_05305, partial [Thermoanaerobaculia bacterium]|nr:hypothetical protein [Thermoanaerobaculia bacterium]